MVRPLRSPGTSNLEGCSRDTCVSFPICEIFNSMNDHEILRASDAVRCKSSPLLRSVSRRSPGLTKDFPAVNKVISGSSGVANLGGTVTLAPISTSEVVAFLKHLRYGCITNITTDSFDLALSVPEVSTLTMAQRVPLTPPRERPGSSEEAHQTGEDKITGWSRLVAYRADRSPGYTRSQGGLPVYLCKSRANEI